MQAHDPQLQKNHLDEAVARAALIELMQCAQPVIADIPYRLVGTAAALLYGIALPAGDIDLLFKESQGVDSIARLLSACSTVTCNQPPLWLPGSRQYFARYTINGVVVELSTVEPDSANTASTGVEVDWLECVGRGPWEHFNSVACGPYFIPTVAIELRLLTELSRNRPERYQPILRYLRTRPCDVDLVRRGMIAHSVAPELQREVLASIDSELEQDN